MATAELSSLGRSACRSKGGGGSLSGGSPPSGGSSPPQGAQGMVLPVQGFAVWGSA
eukprot:CAMPEP_0181176468 /NCGR_PEP_ID=MMETSP1096-20121128/4646_1 /TAXON_ID=156174 ORGANISM="Chrysochromulina ericina, Strain CCMP281" /NCGR_SAMPLE_ID=MMETSP1096 /ASSEMBLY_ACC=CAM_ASM_000453 /LENGTH=55 /DNA_ID=CAMNT_0023264559 /DNA_START=115 /DNA_END=282 /DNA_ORIENTATION=+